MQKKQSNTQSKCSSKSQKPKKSTTELLEEINNAQENGPFIVIKSIFPKNYQFPPAETMTDTELSKKLDEMYNILLDYNIEISFWENVPDRIIYEHLITEIIPQEKIPKEKFECAFTTFTGCTGACEVCFQKDYCEVDEE